ncbi:hypothetical protein FA95DRAFT_271768 [Auriscalpium vulgare]|uniref:Uncharacterized protein n=1 Tax=Auriscalpium vulgare TaxID=40419 RepID=A0ACB8S681_9AGAM|nr:hypothetical protein FA95DRAFT_271768 [Auriscalpium vulgare]
MTTILSELSGSYVSGVSRPFGWRRKQLQGIHDLIQENMDSLVDAATKDKRLVRADVLLELATVVDLVRKQLDEVIKASEDFSRAKAAENGIAAISNKRRKATDAKTPVGIALVNSHWAFPYSSSLGAMAAAYASGNVVALVPPSQPAISSLLSSKLKIFVDQLGYAIVNASETLKGSEQTDLPSVTALDVKGSGVVEPLRTIAPPRNPSAVYVNYTALGPRGEVKFTPRRLKIAKEIATRIVQSKLAFGGQAWHAPLVAFLDTEVYEEVTSQLVTAVKERGSATDAQYLEKQMGLKALVQGPLFILELDAKAASEVKLPSTNTPLLLLSKVTSPDTAIDRLQYLPRLPAFYLFSQEPFTAYVVQNVDSDLTVVNDIPLDAIGKQALDHA